jgi:hypothetical protein
MILPEVDSTGINSQTINMSNEDKREYIINLINDLEEAVRNGSLKGGARQKLNHIWDGNMNTRFNTLKGYVGIRKIEKKWSKQENTNFEEKNLDKAYKLINQFKESQTIKYTKEITLTDENNNEDSGNNIKCITFSVLSWGQRPTNSEEQSAINFGVDCGEIVFKTDSNGSPIEAKLNLVKSFSPDGYEKTQFDWAKIKKFVINHKKEQINYCLTFSNNDYESHYVLYVKGSNIEYIYEFEGVYSSFSRSNNGRPTAGKIIMVKKEMGVNLNSDNYYALLQESIIRADIAVQPKQTLASGMYKAIFLRPQDNLLVIAKLVVVEGGKVELTTKSKDGGNNRIRTGSLRPINKGTHYLGKINYELESYFSILVNSGKFNFGASESNLGKEYYEGVALGLVGITTAQDNAIATRFVLSKESVNVQPENIVVSNSRQLAHELNSIDKNFVEFFKHDKNKTDGRFTIQKQDVRIPNSLNGCYDAYMMSTDLDKITRLVVEINKYGEATLHRGLINNKEYKGNVFLFKSNQLFFLLENAEFDPFLFLFKGSNKSSEMDETLFGISLTANREDGNRIIGRFTVLKKSTLNTDDKTPVSYTIGSPDFLRKDKELKGLLSYISGEYGRLIKSKNPNSPTGYIRNKEYSEVHFMAALYLLSKINGHDSNLKNSNNTKIIKDITELVYSAFLHGFSDYKLLQNVEDDLRRKLSPNGTDWPAVKPMHGGETSGLLDINQLIKLITDSISERKNTYGNS